MTSILYVFGLIKRLFCQIFCFDSKSCGYGTRAGLFRLKMIFNDGLTVEGDAMSTLMRNDQVVTFKPVFRDSFGNEVDMLGSKPVWSLSDDAVGSLAVEEDGMTAVFTPSGLKGSTQVSVLVDADPGIGEEDLVGTADITVLSGKAVMVQLTGILGDKVVAPAEPEPETPAPTEAPAVTEAPVVETPAETPAPTDAPVAGDQAENQP